MKKNHEDTWPRMEHFPEALNLSWLMKDERTLSYGNGISGRQPFRQGTAGANVQGPMEKKHAQGTATSSE